MEPQPSDTRPSLTALEVRYATDAGERAINLGGSTGLAYFRPAVGEASRPQSTDGPVQRRGAHAWRP